MHVKLWVQMSVDISHFVIRKLGNPLGSLVKRAKVIRIRKASSRALTQTKEENVSRGKVKGP